MPRHANVTDVAKARIPTLADGDHSPDTKGADSTVDRLRGMTEAWPDLSTINLKPTLDAFHLWAQVVGKVKLGALPWLNESWHVPLYVSARGLTTGLVSHPGGAVEIEFDLLRGELLLRAADGTNASVPLVPQSVAAFHAAVIAALRQLGADIPISPVPSEIASALPFANDLEPRAFDLNVAQTYWRALISVQRVFHRFRSRFSGKCSPIHFFWGSFDLAVTRFSGRPAPEVTRGGPNFSVAVARDAYADEQASCGFWPGGPGFDEPGFYVEAWPAPTNWPNAGMRPKEACYVEALGEWVLPYTAVRANADPDAFLLSFLQSGYDTIADAGDWDRSRLERAEGPVGHPPAQPDDRPVAAMSSGNRGALSP